MFDDFSSGSGSPFQDDLLDDDFLDDVLADEPPAYREETRAAAVQKRSRSRRAASVGEERIFGMTANQRFLLALMFLFNIIVLGCLALLVTGRVVPPAFF